MKVESWEWRVKSEDHVETLAGFMDTSLRVYVVPLYFTMNQNKSRRDLNQNSTLHTSLSTLTPQYRLVNRDDTQAEPPSQEIWYQATERLS